MKSDDSKSPKKGSNKKNNSDRSSNKKTPSSMVNDELLSNILDAELENYTTKKKLTQENAELLSCMLREHLSCFLILGYDYKGGSATILNSITQKDTDSLNTFLQKYIYNHAVLGKS